MDTNAAETQSIVSVAVAGREAHAGKQVPCLWSQRPLFQRQSVPQARVARCGSFDLWSLSSGASLDSSRCDENRKTSRTGHTGDKPWNSDWLEKACSRSSRAAPHSSPSHHCPSERSSFLSTGFGLGPQVHHAGVVLGQGGVSQGALDCSREVWGPRCASARWEPQHAAQRWLREDPAAEV